MQIQSESRAFKALADLIQGGRPLIYIGTSEESRARQLLQEAARRLFPSPLPVWSWTSTRGLVGPEDDPAAGRPLDAAAVLEFIAGCRSPALAGKSRCRASPARAARARASG